MVLRKTGYSVNAKTKNKIEKDRLFGLTPLQVKTKVSIKNFQELV